MARRITRKELKRDEFVEATVDAGHWIEENWRSVALWGGVVVGLALIVAGWLIVRGMARDRAQAALADGMRIYQLAEAEGFSSPDRLEEALTHFERAAGSSAPGQVASYYSGATLFRLGRTEEAIPPLEQVIAKDDNPPTLVGSATAMLAEAYAANGEQGSSIELLEQLTTTDPPTYPVDQALLRLGALREQAGDLEGAREAWQRIVDEYPVQGAAAEARRLLDR